MVILRYVSGQQAFVVLFSERNMKLIKYKLGLLVLVAGFVSGCKQDDGISVPLQNEVNEFVWLAMNGYYFWESEVEDLSIEKYPTYNDLYTFLNNYPDPKDLFDDLLYEGDRFSWIVDDYETLEQSFQGISKSYGFNLGLVRTTLGSEDLLAYIRYIVPGSPADLAGLKRGDLFTEVDGQQLNTGNYVSLLFESESIVITLSQIQDNVVSTADQEISLSAIQITENPIFLSEILEVEGQKVGYLVYNQFVNNSTYHDQLNSVFGQFQSEGINDLVLDLRYNQGGAVVTSTMLASLVYGAGDASTTFTVAQYNDQLRDAFARIGSDPNQYFTDVIPETTTRLNRLNINRVFILISGSTASASELVISGLDPYMDITLIGSTTVGKNLGSATLYDSPNYSKTPDNSSVVHTKSTYAIQPIISRFTNINNIEYGDGFEPNIVVNEIDFLEGIKPLGDPGEALLSEALAIITGTARLTRPQKSGMEPLADFRLNSPVSTIQIDSKESLNLVIPGLENYPR